jgi:hypothetical protein
LVSRYSKPSKFLLASILFLNFIQVSATTITYRVIWKVLGDRTPSAFTKLCARIVYPDDDIEYIIPREEDSDYYPKEWPLRRIPQSISFNGSTKIELKNE